MSTPGSTPSSYSSTATCNSNPSSPHTAAATTPPRRSRSRSDMSNRDPTLCMYRSKPCSKPRSVKLDGQLHLLCSYHRQRANLNQQRVHQRRKIRMKQRSSSLTEAESGELLEPCSSPCGDLAAHDLKILEILLFYSNSPSPSRKDSMDSTASSNTSSIRTVASVDGAEVNAAQVTRSR
ncbi:hypothetical protein Gpo141_00013799 [Globisporangium polare]